MERIAAFWEKGIARGKTTPDQGAGGQPLLTTKHVRSVRPTLSSKRPGTPELKHSPFAKLDELAPPAVLGTRPPFPLPTLQGRRQDRTGDGHAFFNLFHMKLLELVRHDRRPTPRWPSPRQRGRRWARPPFVKDVDLQPAVWAWCSATAIRVGRRRGQRQGHRHRHGVGVQASDGTVGAHGWSDSTSKGHPANLQRSFNDDS